MIFPLFKRNISSGIKVFMILFAVICMYTTIIIYMYNIIIIYKFYILNDKGTNLIYK